MALTPVEIRHVQLRRAFPRGYRRADVDRLLNEIADSFEDVWRERADLADRLDELETEAGKHRELESLLRTTLVSAERAAQDMKAQARRESDLIVQEAHAEGRRVSREAAAEKRRLEGDIRSIRAQRRTALEALSDSRREARSEDAPAQPAEVEEPTDGGIRIVG
jgi:cell division initiation protein